MNIKISNFKNLKKLDLDIQDNKINYIFGISGSGKSSIGDALKEENVDENVLIGYTLDDVEILVNNNKIEEPLNVFNTNSINKLLVNNMDNNLIYNIVFDNNNKILELQKEFENQISGLVCFKSVIYDYILKIDKMNKIFGGKITKDEKLPNNSKIVKIANAISSSNDCIIVNTIKEKGNWYIPWMKKGYESLDYKENICPFCNKPLDDEIKERVQKILDFNEKDFEVIFQDESILADLGIHVPDYSNIDELNELKDKIISKILFRKELDELINYMCYYNNPSFNPSMLKEISISDELKETFPDLKDKIISVNNSIGVIKSTLGILKQETDRVIAHNIGKLNSYLDRFGINYNFDVTDYSNDNNTLSYSLYNKLDEKKSNRTYGLSFGEKNLISLLLFLLSSKEKFIIIDDPASSFDDYRRKEILTLIYDLCSDKTVLVLSHDHVFIKYAIFNYNNSKKLIDDSRDVSDLVKKYYDCTGKIIAMENYSIGNIVLRDIDYEDFDSLPNHIINFIKDDMEYFRKIINLRLFYECFKSKDMGYIYEYLSAIYHRIPKEEIIKELEKKGILEDTILTDIYQSSNVRLQKIPFGEYHYIDISTLTLFEKILYYRDEEKKEIKESFNNVVHMNESLHVCLNPYKFNYFSPYIYSVLVTKK